MNQLLEQTKRDILQKKPELRPVIDKIVKAGQEVMFSKETRGMLTKQLANGISPEAIGAGIAKLMGILFNQSKNTMPMQAMAPAATVLLCDALQFLEDAGAVTVDKNLLTDSTKAMGSSLLQLFGVTPEKLQGMVNKAQPQQPGIVAQAKGGPQ